MNRKSEYAKRNVVPAVIFDNSENYQNTVGSEIIYQSGPFRYRYRNDWIKWPDELWGCSISGIAAGKNDSIFLTLRNPQAPVVQFDKDGNFVRTIGQDLPVSHLHGISVGHDGTIWVSDDNQHVAFHLSEEGTALGWFGNLGTPSDSGYDPEYIAPDAREKAGNFKVMAAGSNGAQKEIKVSPTAYKSVKRMAGPFNKPTRLVEAPNGRLYASDGYGNAAIHVFDQAGKHLRSWGGPGTALGEFSIPHSLWVDYQNRVWVCDRENDRVQVFDEDGRLLKCLDKLYFVTDVWSDRENVYILENDGRVNIYDMDYVLLAQIGYWQCANMVAHGITGDSNGNLYLADLGINGVFKLERLK